MEVPITNLRSVLVHSYRSGRIRHDQTFLEEHNKIGKEDTLVEIFHENTKYTDPQTIRERASANQFESDELSYIEAQINRDYPGKPRIELSEPEIPEDVALSEVLQSRRSRRSFNGQPLDRDDIANLLGGACSSSLTGLVSFEELGVQTEKTLRRYPSGGALYPVEIYPLILRSKDLPTGLSYYSVNDHSLRILDEYDEEFPKLVVDLFAGDDIDIGNAAVVVVLTANFQRTTAKYGPRGYRHVHQEAGHIVQNLQLVSEALDLASVPAAGYYDRKMNELLGLDGVTEAVVYTAVIGNLGENDES